LYCFSSGGVTMPVLFQIRAQISSDCRFATLVKTVKIGQQKPKIVQKIKMV